MRIDHIEKRFGDLRKLVVNFEMNASGEERDFGQAMRLELSIACTTYT